MELDLSEVKRIVRRYQGKKGVLIPILQDVQAVYGYVPPEAVELVAGELSIYPIVVYGVVTFYSQFYRTPRGRHMIKVCEGTACHVMGGKEILDYLSNTLGVTGGETTEDGMFSLERVACLGCCGMAPVVMIDDDYYGKCTIQKMSELLDKYRSGETGGGSVRKKGKGTCDECQS